MKKKRSMLLAATVWLGSLAAAGAAELYTVKTTTGQFEFAVGDGRAYLTQAIDSKSPEHNFVLPNPPAESGMWRLQFRPPNGDEALAETLTAQGLTPEVSAEPDQSLTLRWTGVKLSNAETVDVTVRIAAQSETDMTDWRITVDNHSTTLGLWTVDFPLIEGLSVGAQGELFAPFGPGLVESDPVMGNSYGGTYPYALCSMQFLGLTEFGNSLYLAAYDPHGYVKDFHLIASHDRAKGMTYQTVQYPENMGVPGLTYEQPYPSLVGIITGNWFDAAKVYRKWVLAESDWMKGKPAIVDRTDWPQWFKELPIWIGFHGMTDENMRTTAELAAELGVPAAVHLYHWHQITFDTKYPDFWPPFESTFRYGKELQDMGVKIMPYINCHLIDQASDSWKNDNAERFIARSPEASQTKTEVWASGEGVKLTPLCPATEYWQQKYLPLTRQLVDELNVDGIYLDQVSCVKPDLCFDTNHGHPVGGGKHWVEGYARMIENIRQEAQKDGRFVFLTTESAAEPYDFDIFLRCNEGAPFLTPIWMAVYSGYRASFGYYFELPEEWLPKLAQQYLQGIQIGWGAAHASCPPEARAFQREVARARYAGSDYLAMGELLRDPKVEGDLARFKATWKNFASLIPIDWPAVRASLWQAPNGSFGVALVNLAPQEQTAKITIPEASIGQGQFTLHAVYPAGLIADQVVTGGAELSFEVTLPPHSASLISLTKTE